MFLFFRFYNKKRTYDPIDYACIDETDFWIVDEDEPRELDVKELETYKRSGRFKFLYYLVEYVNL